MGGRCFKSRESEHADKVTGNELAVDNHKDEILAKSTSKSVLEIAPSSNAEVSKLPPRDNSNRIGPKTPANIFGVPNAGLPNIGNTCFVNAAVLALLHTKELIPLLQHRKSPVSEAFFNINLGQPSPDCVKSLISHFPKFADGAQHCAHSFLLDIFKSLAEPRRVSSQDQADASLVALFRNSRNADLFDIFGNVTQTLFSCYVCIQAGLRDSTVQTSSGGFSWTMSLPILSEVKVEQGITWFGDADCYMKGINLTDKSVYYDTIRTVLSSQRSSDTKSESQCSLNFSIQSLLRVSLMTSDNLTNCKVCKRETQHVKHTYIIHLGSILIFHLQRYDSITRGKDCTVVPIPQTLNMAEYCRAAGQYNLFAVVSHSGELGCGHYWVNLKARGIWYQYNDSETKKKVRCADVLDEHAYVLFYRRNEDKPKTKE